MALITLDDDERRNNFFKLSPRINPICLPHDKENFVKKVTKFIIAGWGKFKGDTETNILRIAEVKKMDNKKCYKALESKEFDAASLGGADFFTDPYGYCLLGKNQERMCFEDNGGPAIAKDNNRAYLVGIGKSLLQKKNNLRSSLNSKEVLQYFLYLYEKKTHMGSFSFFILSNFHYSLMNSLIYVVIDQGIHK